MTKFFVQYRRVIILTLALIVIFWLLWVLRNLLLPFLIGLVLAYLLLPPILWIEKRLPRKNRWMQTKRILLVLLIYLIFLAIVGAILAVTIPVIVNSISQFISNSPQLIPDLITRIQNWANSLRQEIPPEIRDQVTTYLMSLLGTLGSNLQATIFSGLSNIPGTAGMLLGFLSLPIFLFYILKDADKLTRGFYASMSPWTSEQARGIIVIIQDVLGRYIRSSILLGLVVGFVDFVGLQALGIPFAPALGAWAAVTELIPILGPWLGGLAGGIITLATNPDKLVWVILLYFGVQLLEGNLLVPRIHGQFLQIHPAIILILIVIGGHFAGLWGVILIVPVASTVVRLYKFILLTTKKEELQRSQISTK